MAAQGGQIPRGAHERRYFVLVVRRLSRTGVRTLARRALSVREVDDQWAVGGVAPEEGRLTSEVAVRKLRHGAGHVREGVVRAREHRGTGCGGD